MRNSTKPPVPDTSAPKVGSCPTWCDHDKRTDQATEPDRFAHPDDFATCHQSRQAEVDTGRETMLTIHLERWVSDLPDPADPGPIVRLEGSDGSGGSADLDLPPAGARLLAEALLRFADQAELTQTAAKVTSTRDDDREDLHCVGVLEVRVFGLDRHDARNLAYSHGQLPNDGTQDLGAVLVRLGVDESYDSVTVDLGQTGDLGVIAGAIEALAQAPEQLESLYAGRPHRVGRCMRIGESGRCKSPDGH